MTSISNHNNNNYNKKKETKIEIKMGKSWKITANLSREPRQNESKQL